MIWCSKNLSAGTGPRFGSSSHFFNDIQHIVEQTPAEKDGFPRSMIDAPEKLASVPKFKHQEISEWYSTNNEEFGSVTPREYLRDTD